LLSSASPTPSSQNKFPTQENTTKSKDSSTSSNLPSPDLSKDQQIIFSSNASGIITNLPFLNEINQGLYPEIQKELAGLYLTVSQTSSGNFRKTIENIENDPLKPEKLASYQAFFDEVDGMSQQEKVNLINRTIDEFGLYPNMPNRLLVEYTTMTLDFDPSTYQSNIRIRVLEPSDPTLNSDAKDHITVMGSLLDPRNFEDLPQGPLELAGEPMLEEKDVSGLPPQYFLNIPVRGAMDWGFVHVDKGAIKSDSKGDEVGYFLIATGPYGLHHLMAMRPLPLDAQGRSFMTPPTYGAPEPKPLPVVPQDQLEGVMKQDLENALKKAVIYGDIGQKEADDLLSRFDDPQLIDIVKDPQLRAAVLLGASLKSSGGELALPILMGQNIHNSPVRLFFEGDPELDIIFQGKSPPPNVMNGANVRILDDGTTIVIWGKNGKNGQEPIEVIASLITHEVVIHEAKGVSVAEETMGNLSDTISWASLVQRDPSLLTRGTFMTQYNNLLLYALLNTVFVDDRAKAPFTSHVGLTSRITGVQTHNQADSNVLPGNNVQAVKSFYELIQLFSKNGSNAGLEKLDVSSIGTENTLQLFKMLFGSNTVIPDNLGHTDSSGEIVPDFSDLLITDFLDERIQQIIPNKKFRELGQKLHMTLDGRNAIP
jgi:hypothetical protein